MITAIVTAAPLLALVFSVPDDIIDQVADTAILGYVIAYILVAVAAPVFLVRIGEFGGSMHSRQPWSRPSSL